MSKNEIKIWLLFLTSNIILFLPRFLMEFENSSFFPIMGFLDGHIPDRIKYFFNRTNYDLFRLNVDIFLLVFPVWYFKKYLNIKIIKVVFASWYVVILLYLIYYNAFNTIYRSEPLFFNDLHMLSLGFFNIFSESLWILIFSVIGFILIISLLGFMIFRLMNLTQNTTMGRYTKIIVLTLSGLLILNSIRSGFTFNAHHTFQFTLAGIADNLKKSIQAGKQLKNLNPETYPYRYQNFRLTQKPNLHLIFVESYGKIVYDNPAIAKTYLPVIRQSDALLNKVGWKIASRLSTSPVSGGNSWISYTTVLYGLNIKNEGTYHFPSEQGKYSRF
ncbi:MAG: hypothetical protein HC830_04555 [Bacteroidetes bacterium]|nr:hypothetical protein [Bacteroidota bacterium]